MNLFLSNVLQGRPFEVIPLAGDASSRRYFRIVSGSDAWVLMAWEPFEDNGHYPFLSVRDHFALHQVAVPQVIAKSPAEGLVLLEDLGDLTLERKFWENQNQDQSLPFYKQTIDELIKMHYYCTFDKSDCTAFKMEFDTEKLLWEMNYGKEHLLKGLCQISLSDSQAHELEKVFTKICSTLHVQPKFIAHRDYHSRNVMLKHGKARIIDFQDARLGAIQYDLVSLLRDSYVAMNDDMINNLIEYYLDARRSVISPTKLPTLSRDEFNEVFEIQTIQRCFKACGSFSSFFNLRKDTRYLKYLHHTLLTVKRSLEPMAEYSMFYKLLEDNGLFERKFDEA
jgi:aminoglycoside/choline kinase family phosphotransferase